VGEAIARADNEIRKCIIGMQLKLVISTLSLFSKTRSRETIEIDGNEMACNLLSSTSEAGAGVVSQEFDGRPVGTGNQQKASVKTGWCELIEPLACVGRVERFCAFDYLSKNILNSLRRQETIPSESKTPSGISADKHPCEIKKI